MVAGKPEPRTKEDAEQIRQGHGPRVLAPGLRPCQRGRRAGSVGIVALRCPSCVPIVLVVAALATGACDRERASTPPSDAAGPMPTPSPAPDALELRYAIPSQSRPLAQTLELQLTDSRVGWYVEATVHLDLTLELAAAGARLQAAWAIDDVTTLELTGTVKAKELERTRALLLAQGRGLEVGDALGLPDPAATDAAAVNQARAEALAAKAAPPAGRLVMTVLAEQLRLPRLPAKALRLGETVEVDEESETVVAGTELVLPTTTVHRFTLRRIDDSGASRVAELAIELASVAEPEDGATVEARLEARAEGTLLLDVDQGIPVSLELSRTESFRVGTTEGERSLLLRSRYRSAEPDEPPDEPPDEL